MEQTQLSAMTSKGLLPNLNGSPAGCYYQLLASQAFNYKLISKGLKTSRQSSWDFNDIYFL